MNHMRTITATMASMLLALCAYGLGVSAMATTTAPTDTGYSASRLYNQGNHDLQAGRPARAILSYERALVLAPADSDIKANLGVAREAAGLPAQTGSWFDHHAFIAAPNTLYWLGMLGIALAGAGFLAWRFRGSRRGAFAIAAFLGAVITGISVADAIATLPKLSEAVVMQASSVSAAPVVGAEPQFTAPAGEVVHIRDQHEGFSLVRDPQGREGWVARSNLLWVIPAV